jgi:polyisoprenoid-binding protein YceI
VLSDVFIVVKLYNNENGKLYIISLLLMLMNTTLNAQTRKNADVAKTSLNWLGEKVLGKHTGTILLKSGWINWDNNMISEGEFLIDMASLKDDDGNDRLEAHLKSDDFFGTDNYPTSKVVITGSDSFEKGTAIVRGDLTIKQNTHPIEFKATLKQDDKGIWFYANIIVDRTKYNVRYGSGSFFSNLGDNVIYDEFKVKVSLYVR